MREGAPFDVWDGEDLGITDTDEPDAAEEVAMHVDPESEPAAGGGAPTWSDLANGDDEAEGEPPARYFADEQPEGAEDEVADERLPDLQEILQRQHYAS
jgi:hypothetical protein